MSWHLVFHAQSIEAAKARIEKEDAQNTHFPTAIARSVIACLNAMPVVENAIVSVKSTGSVSFGMNGSSPHGNSSLEITLIPFLPTPQDNQLPLPLDDARDAA